MNQTIFKGWILNIYPWIQCIAKGFEVAAVKLELRIEDIFLLLNHDKSFQCLIGGTKTFKIAFFFHLMPRKEKYEISVNIHVTTNKIKQTSSMMH